MNEPEFIASVGYFPERYGNYLIPMALSNLANKPVDDVVLTITMVYHQIFVSTILIELVDDDVAASWIFLRSFFSH